MADPFTPDERAAIIARREPLRVACPTCGEPPGLWCIVGRQRIRSPNAHASRRAASARAVGEASCG